MSTRTRVKTTETKLEILWKHANKAFRFIYILQKRSKNFFR